MSDSRPALEREWRFTQLTAFVLGWMLLAPAFEERWLTYLLLQLFLLNALLTTLRINPGWGPARGVTIGLWLLSLTGSLIAFAPVPAAWEKLARTAETFSLLPLLLVLAAGILRFVYRGQRFTLDGVLATVVVYVLVAIVFSRLYLLLIAFDPASLSLPVAAAERAQHLLQVDLLYYSLITQCSVGYGDVLPVSDTARMIAVLQAIAGQFYMAVVVAIFVGMYASRRGN